MLTHQEGRTRGSKEGERGEGRGGEGREGGGDRGGEGRSQLALLSLSVS